MKKYAVIMLCFCLYSCRRDNGVKVKPYPEAVREDVADDYFGKRVADPYRWLEDDRSPETAAWTEAENAVTEDYLSQIPFRSRIRERLTDIWNYPRYSAPFREGDWYYFFKNDGLQNQSVLYRLKHPDDTPEVFLDPNTLSEDGTVALKSVSFSGNHQYMAYSISRSGSDWQEMFVKDTRTGEQKDDHLKWIKFSSAAWKGDGFYYSRYDEPDEAGQYSGQNRFQKVYFHRLGDPQSSDLLIFEDREHPLRYFSASVTEDEQYLIINGSEGTSGDELYCQSLTGAYGRIVLLAKGFRHNYRVIDHYRGRLLTLTDHGASNYRLVSIDPANPDTSKWTDVIPETVELLEDVSTGGGKLFASYLKNASTRLLQLDYEGNTEREITLPSIGSAGGLGGKREEKTLFYSFTSFATPSTIYQYDVETGVSTLFRRPEVNFNFDDYEVKQVFYPSKDGTRIPMFVVHGKGVRLDGNNPALLYGYGGFNISLTPSFSISRMVFLENGGIYAMPNLRGGGEYGEEWHKAGMLEKKQNVFDDFIAAAEYLIREKYTSPKKLAISGGSNGGLLVGAAMTQRPELFRAALPAVGVMDMLRYQKFTIGWGWVVEYGSSDNEKDFPFLYAYSPLHNMKEGVEYPSTLVTTADHDDRVVPAHSFKFAATLQEKYKGERPMLIRIETKAGHGAGKPVSKAIEEAADTWSFVFHELGVVPKRLTE
ncbi:MAG: prolyl oligopeptidase family serine peptidase [Bacteroidales bacterium]|jgi:prolyl oligopeptidase|nr:prolyl oligopeptidase family serine peptidase [Bacteroidales bacterium]